MTALERVEELKREAVALLTAEREEIDRQLAILGEQKRRGRPPKEKAPDESGVEPMT